MRRFCLLMGLLGLVWGLASPGWAWPPTLEQFSALAKEAAPPGWRFSEALELVRTADCAPQYVAVFENAGCFLEYRLDLDARESEDQQVPGLRRNLEGCQALYLQAGDWQRFTYLTVYFPAHMASLTLGLNDDLSFEEMAALYYAFPRDKLLPLAKATE